MDILNLGTIVVALTFAIYWYIKFRHNFWKKKGIPYIEPDFYYGNIKRVVKRETSFADEFREMYVKIKAMGQGHGGVYMLLTPMYLPTDLELIRCIMQKDFNHFVNHGIYHDDKADPLSGHLFNLEDAKWKTLRAKLTPTFTSGKMKMMFDTLVKCSDGLEELLNENSVVQDPLDIKDLLGRFTTDVIGSCAFGLDCNSLKDPNSEFRKYGKKIFESTFEDRVRFFLTKVIPNSLLHKLGFRTTPKEVETFFTNVVRNTVDYREKNNIIRKDFMHLMLQLKNQGKIVEDGSIDNNELPRKNELLLTMDELTHCFIFFGAGFETSSTTMTFALYELSVNQEIQDKLREEIINVLKKYEGKLTYESIMEMTYLDKIINETLRMHPPVPGIPRMCNKAYKVPGKNFTLMPDTEILIPVYGIHMDPEYYPNPEVFDPERFSEENKAKRPSYTFLPFGDGPRICIGLRFGVMQAKVGLVRLLKDFNVTLNKKTSYPLQNDPLADMLAVKGGVWLNVTKVRKNDTI